MQQKPNRQQTLNNLKFCKLFGTPKIWAHLLGLIKAENYCNNLPLRSGLFECVKKIAQERGLLIEQIFKSAEHIPKFGPILVTANHPTGILDGVVILCAILHRRNDVCVVANELLYKTPVLGDYIIAVNKMNENIKHDLNILFKVRRAWQKNQCVVVFPAGTVAHWQWNKCSIADAPWNGNLQDFATKLDIPEFRGNITLKNPIWFHLLAPISKRFRLIFLLHAFFYNNAKQSLMPISFKRVVRN